MMKDFFRNKKYNRQKLLKFGFKEKQGSFSYNCCLPGGQFELSVNIDKTNSVSTRLTETATGELYTLHLVEGADGSFVGKVKEEYCAVLQKISDSCFDLNIFKTKQAVELIKYIEEKYGDELEFLWEKFPDNAIVRRKDNLKWYAAFLTVSRQKFGFQDLSMAEVIDLRVEDANKAADNRLIFPGYHMNKKYWISIILDGSVSSDVIKTKIDESYMLALKKK